MHELGAEARRKDAIRDAIARRKYSRRHVEGAENDIEQRKSSGEILFAAGSRRRVMPAMKTGEATTYLKGPSVQSRLACTKAECARVKGASRTKTLGDIPAKIMTTPASTALK